MSIIVISFVVSFHGMVVGAKVVLKKFLGLSVAGSI